MDRVEQVRRSVLTTRSSVGIPAREPPTGRLALSEFENSCFDGASAHVSDGFFDDHEVPPLDSWVAVLDLGLLGSRDRAGERGIVFWVAPEWTPQIAAAIEYNPVEVLAWLDPCAAGSRPGA